MLQKLRQLYDDFEQTIAEGNYRTQPQSLWSIFASKRDRLPETTDVVLGATMVGTSRN